MNNSVSLPIVTYKLDVSINLNYILIINIIFNIGFDWLLSVVTVINYFLIKEY